MKICEESTTYRPFTFEDSWKDYFRNRWIRHKVTKNEYVIMSMYVDCIDNLQISQNHFHSFEAVFKQFENLDGSPLGIEE